MRDKFSFVYVDIWFHVKVYINCEKQQYKMLVALSPIFVADTKIIFLYNIVDPLRFSLGYLKLQRLSLQSSFYNNQQKIDLYRKKFFQFNRMFPQ